MDDPDDVSAQSPKAPQHELWLPNAHGASRGPPLPAAAFSELDDGEIRASAHAPVDNAALNAVIREGAYDATPLSPPPTHTRTADFPSPVGGSTHDGTDARAVARLAEVDAENDYAVAKSPARSVAAPASSYALPCAPACTHASGPSPTPRVSVCVGAAVLRDATAPVPAGAALPEHGSVVDEQLQRALQALAELDQFLSEQEASAATPAQAPTKIRMPKSGSSRPAPRPVPVAPAERAQEDGYAGAPRTDPRGVLMCSVCWPRGVWVQNAPRVFPRSCVGVRRNVAID